MTHSAPRPANAVADALTDVLADATAASFVPTATARPVRRVVPAAIVVLVVALRASLLTIVCLLLWASLPRLGGWIPTTVMTGSMQPSVMVGDVVVSMPIDGANARPGQVVLADPAAQDDQLLLHRVREVTDDGLRLQGDANSTPDRRLVPVDAVLGVGVLRVPIVGLPTVWVAEGRWGAVGAATAGVLLVGAGVVLTRRLVADPELDPEHHEARHPDPRPVRVLRTVGTVAGLTVTIALVALSITSTAGATVVWSGGTSSGPNRLDTGSFRCLDPALGAPTLRFAFDAPTGIDAHNSGTGPGTGQLAGDTERRNGTCADSPSVHLGGVTSQVTTMPQLASPTTFSTETWFRTTAAQGKLVGFGNAQTVASGSHDRHMYIDTAGHLVFGMWDGGPELVTTNAPVTDGQWHHAVATFSDTTGMHLYLDGAQVGSNPTTVSQSYRGYWRIGFDTISSSWPGAPTALHFVGDLDGVSVYDRVLPAQEVAEHAQHGH